MLLLRRRYRGSFVASGTGAWSGTEEVSILELANLVRSTLGSRSEIEFVPYARAYAAGFEDMMRRKPVVDKLRKVTEFAPATPLLETVRRTIEGLGP
jgi:UDP-glucose 4-epimerase